MSAPKQEDSFWTRYKKFATTEILMYLIMIIGIGLGILILS
jgi:type IV secretory pathway TrbL component